MRLINAIVMKDHMQVIPKDGPSLTAPLNTSSALNQSMREKAIAALLDKPEAAAPSAPIDAPLAAAVEGQPSTIEAPASVEPVAPKAPEEPLSSQYAALARREKAIRAKAQAQEADLRTKEAALAAREQALSAKDAEYSSKYIPKDRLKQNALEALAEAGLSYDDITQQAMSAPQQQPQDIKLNAMIAELKSEIQALKGAQDKTVKTFEDQQAQSYKQALNQIKNETKTLVSSDPAFETIKATDSYDDVVDLIERTFKEDGVLMTVEDAAKAVEDYLMEEAYKLSSLSKIQQRLKAAQLQPSKPTDPKQPQTLKTLTNATSSSRQLSARERALLAFEGKLNK